MKKIRSEILEIIKRCNKCMRCREERVNVSKIVEVKCFEDGFECKMKDGRIIRIVSYCCGMCGSYEV